MSVSLQQAAWPLVVRASGALVQCGLGGKFYSRFGVSPSDGTVAELRKADGAGNSHYHQLIWFQRPISGDTRDLRTAPFIPSQIA
jgi:hypothetical protein